VVVPSTSRSLFAAWTPARFTTTTTVTDNVYTSHVYNHHQHYDPSSSSSIYPSIYLVSSAVTTMSTPGSTTTRLTSCQSGLPIVFYRISDPIYTHQVFFSLSLPPVLLLSICISRKLAAHTYHDYDLPPSSSSSSGSHGSFRKLCISSYLSCGGRHDLYGLAGDCTMEADYLMSPAKIQFGRSLMTCRDLDGTATVDLFWASRR
jgi:hypothetical protein